MLSGEGNAGERWKTTIGLFREKKATLHVQHTFLYISLPLFHDYNVKLPETSYLHVLWRKCRTCSRSLFFFLLFILTLVAASFSHFVTAATKFFSRSSNKKMSPLFSLSCSRSLSPFFSLSFASLPPTFSFSLSFSCSIFQICGHDN